LKQDKVDINMEKKQLFRQASLNHMTSPEQLNQYIKITNPSIWLILLAVIILLASLLVWSAFGALPTTIAETGYVENGVMTCYVADVSEIKPGMQVKIGDQPGTVASISDTPYSSREISEHYSDDYTIHMLGIGDWDYAVTVNAPGVKDGLVEATIITGEVHPISFIFN